ncbi:MAG: hypothetical protein K2O18_11450 [Oscillospiraceae bacterium]|nr:hypothetical protein [Oscillospiraceae bacterium]
MKKLASLILSAALTLALTAPAAAAAVPSSPTVPATSSAPTSDQRLASVTAKVKATLGIGDEYTEFYGDLSETEISPFWDLNWSADGIHLNVEATETGKILSYYLSETDNDPYAGIGNFPPTFPAVSRTQARQSAEAFLKKVLQSPESYRLSEQNTGMLDTATHRFSGEIRLNGLSSPMTFSLTVRASDGKIIRFYRDSLERNVLGDVPSAKSNTSAASAGALLKKTMDLRLEYVLEDEDKAVLRYLPEPGDEYYVDAQSGQLVNLTGLYEKLGEEGDKGGAVFNGTAAMPEAAADTAASGLSQAEQAGVAKLEGVLSKEELDEKLQQYTALGLKKYTLASASYTLDKKTDDVTARLIYTRKDGGGTWRRTVTCDGRTGELQSVSSSAPYEENRKTSVSVEDARKKAEAFLTEFWGDEFAATELYGSDASSKWNSAHSFTYAQKENGYFFPENSLRVSIDVTDGTVSGLRRSWTDGVSFDSPEGILDKSAALDAWFSHYDMPLAYSYVPVKLDPGMDGAKPLMDMGYSYFYQLKLSYAVKENENRRYASGVDAKTGEVVYMEMVQLNGEITYSDIGDHWAKPQIEALARYGIGWYGGECRPREELTQFDYITLLLSTDGYRYIPGESEADSVYNRAYQMGILTRGERDSEKILTRGEAIQMLLGSAGYGNIAKMQGIFTCSFPDRAEIPANMLGWAALAQGLGVVSADSDFAAGRSATRAEAVVMLYNFMSQN